MSAFFLVEHHHLGGEGVLVCGLYASLGLGVESDMALGGFDCGHLKAVVNLIFHLQHNNDYIKPA